MGRSIALFVTLVLASGVWADYVMPPFQVVVEEVTSIVDATVVEREESGKVRINVHRVLKGNAVPEVLTGARYSCFGVDLSRTLKMGQRYVLLLYGLGLYEEGTFYEVRKGQSGLECNCWDGSDELRRRWMPIAEFERQLVDAKEDR